MVLTPEQRAEFLQRNGYDPSQTSYDESTGNIYSGANTADLIRSQTTPQPGALEPTISQPASSSSFFKVAGKTALSELGPTGVALAAGTLAQRATSRIPYVGIPVGLAAGYFAGKYAGQAQEKLLPESVKENIYPTQQEITEHPWAHLAGQVVAAAPFVNPIKSIQTLGRAGKDAWRLLANPAEAYAGVGPANIAALKQTAANTAVGVGSQAGLNAYQQLKSGQPFDYRELARQSALGAILQEPTGIGRRVLRMEPSGYERIPTSAERIAQNMQEFPPNQPELTRPEYSYKAVPEVAKPPPLPTEPTPSKAPEVRTPELVQADINKNTELMKQNLELLSSSKDPIYQDAVNAIDSKLNALRTELNQAKQNITQPKEAPRQFFGGGLGRGNFKYAENEPTAPTGNQPLEQEIQNLLAKRGIRPGQYKVQITDASGKPILGAKTGKPILGRAEYPTRTVHLSTEASKAIPYHEAGHIYFEDLARSGDARDKQLVQNVLKEMGHPETVDEYVALNDKAQAGDEGAAQRLREIEEPLMDRAGFEGAQRAQAKGTGAFKQWFKDYLSRFGLGKEPAQQQFSARLEHEVPFGARQELTKGKEQAYAINQVGQQGRIPGEPEEGIGSGKENESITSNRLRNQEEGGREGQLQEGGGQGQGHDVTQGKNAEIEPESLDKPKAYGHWISPSGEMIRVPSEQHSRVAAKLLEDKLGVQPENIQLPYTQLFEKGWARGVHSKGEYSVESKSPLTQKQISALKNYGIERDTNVSGEVQGKTLRETQFNRIFTKNEVPPDFGKSAEEEPTNPEEQKPSGRTPQIISEQIADIKKKIASIEEYKTKAPNNKYLDVSIQGFKNKISQLEDELGGATKGGKNAEEEPSGFKTASDYNKLRNSIEPTNTAKAEIKASHTLLFHIAADINKPLHYTDERFILNTARSVYNKEKTLNEAANIISKKYNSDLNYTEQAIDGYLEKYEKDMEFLKQYLNRGKNAEEEPSRGMEKQLQGAAFGAQNKVRAKDEEMFNEGSRGLQQDLALAEKFKAAIKVKHPNANPSEDYLLSEIESITNHPDIEKAYRKKFGDEIIDEIKNTKEQIETEKQQNFSDLDAEYKAARQKYQLKTSELEAYQHPMQEDAKMFGKNSEIFTSTTDRISAGDKKDRTHTKVTKSLNRFFNDADTNYGRYGQSVVRLFQNYKQPEVENVYRREWEKANNQPQSRALSQNEQKLDAELQPLLQRPENDARRLGAKDIPSRFNIIDPGILDKIDNQPTSIDAKRSLRQWEDWIVSQGASRQDAKEAINSWQTLHRNHGNIEGSRIEQYGLPWELIDKNPGRAALAFGRRTGFRLSWLEHVRNDPEMQVALGVKDAQGRSPQLGSVPGIDYIGHEKAVQDALKFAYNIQAPESPRLQATAQAVSNLVMGPGTATRNILSIPGNLAPYDVTMSNFLKGLANIKQATARAYEQGATRITPSELEFLGDTGNPDKVVRTLNKMSSFLRKWSGRDASDRFESNLYYSIGEQWAASQLVKARNGDANAKRLLSRVTGSDTPLNTSIPDIAKGFVNVVRGTYGPQGLPPWMLSGNLAPFVALNKYSVEKWNNVYKDVFQPMKQGNIGPFLKYTLVAAGITGPVIEQINELLSGHKGSDLNIKEAMAAYAETGNPEIIASKVIGLAQLSGYAGIAGDLAKLGSRVVEGKSLAYNNPISFPLYTLATQTIAQNVSGLASAINSGEDPLDAFGEFVKSLAIQTSQAGRYVSGNIPSEENTRKSEFQDIRKYEEATGRRANDELGQSSPNKYLGLATRNFKENPDLGEAIQDLPALFQRAFEKAGNDPYRLKSEFNKIKQNSYRSMPSMKDQPLEFFAYLDYLRKTQGEEVASQRLTRFLTQQVVNKAKASLVP